MLWRAAQLHGSYAQDGHDHELRRVVTQSRLPWNDMAGRVADERQKELDAIRRRSDETYWSARLANRWDADCPADASLEPDPHSGVLRTAEVVPEWLDGLELNGVRALGRSWHIAVADGQVSAETA